MAGQSGQQARHRALILIAVPAAVAIWSGWVGLGGLCGFGLVHPLPGIWPALQINTAITLPIGVEAYGAYALRAWLAPSTPDRARAFAFRSAMGALAYGMAGQVIYHLLAAAHVSRAPWPIVVLVSCMPVTVLGFAAMLSHLMSAPDIQEDTAPAPVLDKRTEAVRLSSRGQTQEDIAGQLDVTPRTVRRYLASANGQGGGHG